MSKDAYQQHLDQLFGVTPAERHALATHRRLPPRLFEVQRAQTGLRALFAVGVFTVVLVVIVGLFGWQVAQDRLEITEAALFAAPVVLISLLVIGVAVYGLVQTRRALREGVIEVRQGILQARSLHSKAGHSCTVAVDDAGFFRIGAHVYPALAQGQPHRLYLIRGTSSVLAIEPAV
ncbi:MAG: hypothetical protein Q8Q09_09395 [Deltaproteobacteria bacterium]|nr:hypothetical protein [Deltaproteobacteria bacterium]